MRKKLLLIADDEPSVHTIFPEALGEGYEYLHATNGVDALVLAVDRAPELVILDISMPILDGRAVCKKLKEYPKTSGVKIIMVSGKNEQFERALGFELGADDYLGKPVALSLLKSTVEKLLR